MERTLIIIKPDAVQRGLIGQIIQRFEQRGLRIAALKFEQISQDLARRHYAVHKGKPFYEPLVAYITSGPVTVMILEGKDAIQVARRTMGATKPAEATPGTSRADFAIEVGRNLVHGSDGRGQRNIRNGIPSTPAEKRLEEGLCQKAPRRMLHPDIDDLHES